MSLTLFATALYFQLCPPSIELSRRITDIFTHRNFRCHVIIRYKMCASHIPTAEITGDLFIVDGRGHNII